MWSNSRQIISTVIRQVGKHSKKFATAQGSSKAAEDVKLVIFDKDGTLLTFEDSWIDWTINMTDKFAEKLQKPIHDELYHMMGFNAEKRTFRDGLICDTDENILKELSLYLQKHGLSPEEATEFSKNNFFCYKQSNHTSVAVDDPREVFSELQRNGIKVAVCTSDSAHGKDVMVDHLDLHRLIDFSLCGDEATMQPKPYPGNIHHICESLGISAANTVMVGDAIRDMEMGQGANVHLSVGVLSGVCEYEQLDEVADVVVDSIKDVLPLVIPEYKQRSQAVE